MEDNKIISALISLVGACNSNPKTKSTDYLLIKALAFQLTQTDADDANIQALIEEIYAEKYRIAPGCASCQEPCGNTSDYDMSRIYKAEADIRDLKLEMLLTLKKLAADLYNSQELNTLSEESTEIFYKVLAYISYDIQKDSLLTFWNDIQEDIQKIVKLKTSAADLQ